MGSRLAGRLLTSPLAFLAGGVLDFFLFAGATIGRTVCSHAHRMFRALSNIDAR